MSFLYPLLLAGVAAIGIPIVLHMIRRRTRNRVTFSSLMFVPATVPRFRDRSRLENLPLLILRCLIFCLLAFAFSRPFFRRPAVDNSVQLAKQIVVLIDTSASMRRSGIWTQAVAEAQSVLSDAGAEDRVCVMSFDQNTSTLMGFEQWAALEPARRASMASKQISELSLSWARTNLGQALVAAAEAIEDDEVNETKQTIGSRRVVLISDVQQGSSIESLSAYEWPEQTQLVVKSIRCEGATNAALQLVADRGEPAGPDSNDRLGVRITNSSDATAEQFALNWVDESGAASPNRPAGVYVPPGHSIVVRAPARPEAATAGKLVLTGDDHDFDNALYIAPLIQQQINILYIGGDEPNNPKEMLFYLRLAFAATRTLTPHLVSHSGDKAIPTTEIEKAHLIIAAEAITGQNIVSLRRYLESGRTILFVMTSPGASETVAKLLQIDSLESTEAEVDRYAMLTPIDFKHPLLACFAEPRFSDFTKIHFWKYRRIDIGDCPGARVLAWFDTDDPAWFEMPVGKGSLIVFTSAFNPADSQLALSSKFVPLLYSILEYGGLATEQQLQYFVGDNVPIPHLTSRPENVAIRKPDGSLIRVDAERQIFTETALPGIYTVESSGQNRFFAVNVPARECRTAPMPTEDLEKLGVALEPKRRDPDERTAEARNYSSLAETEYDQKVWRWILVATLAVLLIEIALAGWLTRPGGASQGEQK